MQSNKTALYRFFLAFGDLLALVLSFTAAYVLRVSLSDKPFPNQIASADFITSVFMMLPFWIVLFYTLGLYSREVYDYKPRELSRLLIAAVLGIMMMISFSFFTNIPLFPAKMVAVYALLISFALLVVIRSFIRMIRLISLDHGKGLARLVIVGNNDALTHLAKFIDANKRSGYRIVALVADDRFIPPTLKKAHRKSIEQAIEQEKPDVIMQTDAHSNSKVYDMAVDHHLDYQYVPSHQALLNTKHSTEIIGTMPVIIVRTTPLVGYGRIVKRGMDIVGSILALILSSPLWLVTTLLLKITEPGSPVLFLQQRLSRFNKPVFVYKFRTMKKAYNGLTPEEAFAKMGKPELTKQYRANGDQLERDPRITPLGHFLRATSIDELPQLLNVLRGDISLVGPRALVPSELKQYAQKHLILSVKSGLTGLAQISGRRDISFDERRALDIYYVHNWSLWMDIQIIIKTIWHVIFRKGAV
jgi:exopolysaccharide biosynthesis polyprenyl glycosylphosphotransferase